MSVLTETSEIDYDGNNVTTVFPVPFPWLDDEQIVATVLTDGDATPVTLIDGVDYTLSGAGDASGSLTCTTAPLDTETLHIERTVEILQETAFTEQGSFAPATHEDAMDFIVYICQMLARRLAVVEALGSLVPATSYESTLLTTQFTTNATLENTFPFNVALPSSGLTITGAKVVKKANVTTAAQLFQESVDLDWGQTGDNLVVKYLTGLEPSTEYSITIEVTTT